MIVAALSRKGRLRMGSRLEFEGDKSVFISLVHWLTAHEGVSTRQGHDVKWPRLLLRHAEILLVLSLEKWLAVIRDVEAQSGLRVCVRALLLALLVL